jgi:DNA (cytosine-5)-methyltransferase 1
MTTLTTPRQERIVRLRGQHPACKACDRDAKFLRSSRPAYEKGRRRLRLVDLFCGCGGLSLGVAEAARRLGVALEIPLAMDLDSDAVAVYGDNFPSAVVRQQAVEEVFDGQLGARLSSAERRVAREAGHIDALVGGPPCQGHSDLNNHTRRSDDRNGLYARMARAAQVLRPTIVLIENVPMVTRDVERVLDVVREALAHSGYRIADRVVDLTLLGVPQRRRRHVLVATREPAPDSGPLLESLESQCMLHPNRSVRWAVGDLVGAQAHGMFDTSSTPSPDNVRRMRWLLDHDEYDLPNRLRPSCHRSEHSYVSMYGRLRWREPAQTVTTGFGSMGQGRYVHPAKPRTITPHEAARLQMLPDFWDFGSARSRGALARLIGNAVPPPLATAICEKVLSSTRMTGIGR